ncbi:hypothetical protein CAMGR0001_1445 [Campylobacter gracilis RM3268]|uniref:Uncharacterized protein n=1 Tax=Campylobacter gracilis RM3268 TaxID=553220 RepID=C8PJP5_9BACT|nr:hypothetical protein CAMGR0001_1445 [Campylobacter gracilis RM3268]
MFALAGQNFKMRRSARCANGIKFKTRATAPCLPLRCAPYLPQRVKF